MTSTKKRRATAPALHPDMERGRLTRDYLDCYGGDEHFRRALSYFVAKNRAGIALLPDAWWRTIELDPDHAVYVAAARAFAAKWRLDLIPGGHEILTTWCRVNRDYPDCTPEKFRTGAMLLFYGTWVSRPMPFLVVHVEERTDLSSETAAQARERLLALCAQQIDEGIARLRQEAEEAGYVFASGQKREIETHLRWLYHYIVYGKSYASIATSEKNGMNEEVVRKRIAHYRRALDLGPTHLPDPDLAPTPEPLDASTLVPWPPTLDRTP